MEESGRKIAKVRKHNVPIEVTEGAELSLPARDAI